MGQILNHPDYRMRQILRYLKFSDTFISLLPSRKIIIKKKMKPFIPLTRLPLASRLKFKRLKKSLKIIHFPPWKSKFCEKWTDILLASFKTTGKKNLYEIRRSSQLRTLLKLVVVSRTWKNFRPVRDLNPWPLRYRCSALPIELTSQLGAG